jgi:hypothetical protein
MCAYACAEFPSDLTSITRGDAAKEAEAPGGASREHEPRPSVSPNFSRAPPLGMVADDESGNLIEVPRVILLSPHRWRSASKAIGETSGEKSMSQSSGDQEACNVQASRHQTGGNQVPRVTPRDTLIQPRAATDMVALALDFRELERKGNLAEAAAVAAAAAAAAAAEEAAVVSDTTWQEREWRKAIVWQDFVQHSLEALK